ncbi:hypothetical protein J6590_089161 [Homalodisca vitripennis]|nr:hypothetical protein J6590_089161 [Homalodisca vitripennis]
MSPVCKDALRSRVDPAWERSQVVRQPGSICPGLGQSTPGGVPPTDSTIPYHRHHNYSTSMLFRYHRGTTHSSHPVYSVNTKIDRAGGCSSRSASAHQQTADVSTRLCTLLPINYEISPNWG